MLSFPIPPLYKALSLLTLVQPLASYAANLPQTTLQPLVITATKTPTAVTNTIAQTAVIDREQLQRYQGQSALDVLKTQPSFSFYESGGQGTASNFWLRGFSGRQVLVLVDGMRYSSMTTGIAALNLLPASQIERIEVLYGSSGSSLYGSEAMGGVIQIFTKGQTAQQSNTAVTLGSGSEHSYLAQASTQYVHDQGSLSLSVGREKTDGINAVRYDPKDKYTPYNPDKDGFDTTTGSIVAKYQINPVTQAGITGLWADSTTDIDTGMTNTPAYADQKNAAGSVFLDYQADRLTGNLRYGESIDKSKTHSGATVDNYDTHQRQANLQLGYQLPVGQVIGGLERLEQKADIDTVYNKFDKKRTINSEFVGYQIANEHYDVQANLRHDDNSQYGNKNTYNLGAAYHITSAIRVGASYATGFHAPTLNDLYAKSAYFNGNPELNPETSKNTELFIEHMTDNSHTRLTGYHSTIKDGINYNDNYDSMINVDKSRIKGLTLTSDWQQAHTLFGVNYDYQDTEDKRLNKELTYHPNDKGLVYIGYRLPAFDIRAEAQYVGRRYTNADNTRSLPSYTLINLSGNYYINPNLTVNARLNNLTDKDYETISPYNNKGINSFVSLTYRWF